jgi:hypothetical protein
MTEHQQAKKLGFKYVRVDLGIFDCPIRCVVGPVANLERCARWLFDDDSFELHYDGARALYIGKKGHAPVIWLPRVPRDPDGHARLAHELMHAIRYILTDWAEMPLCRENDETYAYAMGHATKTILEGLTSKGNR